MSFLVAGPALFVAVHPIPDIPRLRATLADRPGEGGLSRRLFARRDGRPRDGGRGFPEAPSDPLYAPPGRGREAALISAGRLGTVRCGLSADPHPCRAVRCARDAERRRPQAGAPAHRCAGRGDRADRKPLREGPTAGRGRADHPRISAVAMAISLSLSSNNRPARKAIERPGRTSSPSPHPALPRRGEMGRLDLERRDPAGLAQADQGGIGHGVVEHRRQDAALDGPDQVAELGPRVIGGDQHPTFGVPGEDAGAEQTGDRRRREALGDPDEIGAEGRKPGGIAHGQARRSSEAWSVGTAVRPRRGTGRRSFRAQRVQTPTSL